MEQKEQTTFKDFGIQKSGTLLEVKFTTGREIEKAVPDCGCTSVKAGDKEFKIKYTVPYYKPIKGFQEMWVRSKGVTVYFDDGTKQRYSFRVEIDKNNNE